MPHSIWISPSPCIQIIAWSFYLTCKSSLMKTYKRNAWSFISGVIAFNRYLQRPCNLKFCEKRCTCATFRALASRWRRAKSYTWKQLGRGWLMQRSWFHFLVYEKWPMSAITTKFEPKIWRLPCLKFDNNLSFIRQTQFFFCCRWNNVGYSTTCQYTSIFQRTKLEAFIPTSSKVQRLLVETPTSFSSKLRRLFVECQTTLL